MLHQSTIAMLGRPLHRRIMCSSKHKETMLLLFIILLENFLVSSSPVNEAVQLLGPQIKAEVRSGDLMALESSESTNQTVKILPFAGANNNTETAESTQVKKIAKLFPADWSTKVNRNGSLISTTLATPPPEFSETMDMTGQATQLYSTAIPLITKTTKTAYTIDARDPKQIAIDAKTLATILLHHLGTSNKFAELVSKLETSTPSPDTKATSSYRHRQVVTTTTKAPQFFRRAQLNDYDSKPPPRKDHMPYSDSKSQHFYSDKGHGYNIQFPTESQGSSPEPYKQPLSGIQYTSHRDQDNEVRKDANPPPMIQKRISSVSYESTGPKPGFGSRLNNGPKRKHQEPVRDNQPSQEHSDSDSHSGESSGRSSEEFDFATPVPGFHDAFEDREPVSDSAPSFAVPKIDLRPESLQQKGCKTIVKEVQHIPLDHLKASGSELFGFRSKRDVIPRRVTSIIMTKECHFPGDEASATEEKPKYYPHKEESNVGRNSYNPTYEDDKDIMKKVSSSRVHSSVPSYYERHHDTEPPHIYGAESSRDDYHSSPKHDFDFDMDLPSFLKQSSEDYRSYGPDDHDDGGKVHESSRRGSGNNRKSNKPPVYVVKQIQPKGGKDDGKKTKVYVTVTSSDPPKSASDKRDIKDKSDSENKSRRQGRPTPKTVNRSFAVFSRDDGDDKDPNNKEYSVSYSQGKYSSFSEDYDSDRDGDRNGKY